MADLFRSLERHGFSVGALHGDMDQRSRMTMLANFKDGNIKLLVASDVAARGLDIPDVSHVFNFDVPIHSEDYVHRIGRTGRAGRSGKAFTIVTRADTKYVDAIEKLIAEKIEWQNGDLTALPAPMESHDSDRGGRKVGRERGGKDRSRGNRHEQSAAAAAAPQEKQIVTEETGVEAVLENTKSERRSDKKNQPANNRGRERRQSPANDDNRDRRRYRDHDDGPTPVGFGDDIPAFMLIVANAAK